MEAAAMRDTRANGQDDMKNRNNSPQRRRVLRGLPASGGVGDFCFPVRGRKTKKARRGSLYISALSAEIYNLLSLRPLRLCGEMCFGCGGGESE
jgi:hypothetical protein